MSKYTPNTEEVRQTWIGNPGPLSYPVRSEDRFDAWLSGVVAAAKAEALEQAADDIDLPGLLAYERINAEAAAESWLRVRAAVLRDTEGKQS